jgi:hypothetical protein
MAGGPVDWPWVAAGGVALIASALSTRHYWNGAAQLQREAEAMALHHADEPPLIAMPFGDHGL